MIHMPFGLRSDAGTCGHTDGNQLNSLDTTVTLRIMEVWFILAVMLVCTIRHTRMWQTFPPAFHLQITWMLLKRRSGAWPVDASFWWLDHSFNLSLRTLWSKCWASQFEHRHVCSLIQSLYSSLLTTVSLLRSPCSSLYSSLFRGYSGHLTISLIASWK